MNHIFFKEMRGLRKRHGLSQREVAQRLGISQTLYSDLERGYKPISEEMAAAFLAAVDRKEGGAQ